MNLSALSCYCEPKSIEGRLRTRLQTDYQQQINLLYDMSQKFIEQTHFSFQALAQLTLSIAAFVDVGEIEDLKNFFDFDLSKLNITLYH